MKISFFRIVLDLFCLRQPKTEKRRAQYSRGKRRAREKPIDAEVTATLTFRSSPAAKGVKKSGLVGASPADYAGKKLTSTGSGRCWWWWWWGGWFKNPGQFFVSTL